MIATGTGPLQRKARSHGYKSNPDKYLGDLKTIATGTGPLQQKVGSHGYKPNLDKNPALAI